MEVALARNVGATAYGFDEFGDAIAVHGQALHQRNTHLQWRRSNQVRSKRRSDEAFAKPSHRKQSQPATKRAVLSRGTWV
jgi:hypothetical protein